MEDGLNRIRQEPLFETHTLHELLFGGYRVAFLDRMKEIAAGFGMDVPDKLPNNSFGLMVGVSVINIQLLVRRPVHGPLAVPW